MKRAMLLVSLLTVCGACRPQQMELEIVLPGDGGCPPVDLSCVNYLQFKVSEVSEVNGKKTTNFTTHCIMLKEELHSLCDLQKVAVGQELFKLSPDNSVSIEMRGIRVYPATSCDYDVTCPPYLAFSGTTGTERQVSELAGGELPLPVELLKPCRAGIEKWFPAKPGQQCTVGCEGGEVECDGIQGGCLCFYPTQTPTPDAGRPGL